MGEVVAAVLGFVAGMVVGMWAALWFSRPTLVRIGWGTGRLVGFAAGVFVGLQLGKGGKRGKR